MNKNIILVSLSIFSLLLSGCGEVDTSSSATTLPSSSTTSLEPEPEKSLVKFYVDSDVYYECSILKGEKSDVPVDPIKVGYSFIQWLNEDNTPWDKDTPITSDVYNVHAEFDYKFLDVPVVIVNTDENQTIESNEIYTTSKVSILNTKDEWNLNELTAGVRLRGYSSLWHYPKKSYRIKFDKKQSVLGSSYKAKSWTLIANHCDKTLLRNYIAYELGERFAGIDFSPKHTIVELYINNDYKGVYLLCDQVQTGTGRVAIDESVAIDGNNGFLLERDGHEHTGETLDQDYFFFQDEDYVIKTPDTEKDEYITNKEVEVNYIKNYMQSCWDAIDSGTWAEVDELIDIDSFVDSYILDELFANTDCGFSSCYYYKDKNGKFFKGPPWDFDTGAGNLDFNTIIGDETECPPDTGLYANQVNAWYKLFWTRPEFISCVKDKMLANASVISEVIELLNNENENNLYLTHKAAMDRNFDRWKIMGEYIWPEPITIYSLDTIEKQMSYFHDWLQTRYTYINGSLALL